jgi:hypothetical protein
MDPAAWEYFGPRRGIALRNPFYSARSYT